VYEAGDFAMVAVYLFDIHLSQLGYDCEMAKRFLVGVDEAGRGPLAGPVSAGVVKVPAGFNFKMHFPDARDSKVLSEAKREAIYKRLVEFKKAGKLDFSVQFSSAATIDKVGITKAVHLSIYKGIALLAPNPRGVRVLLDGLLHAPVGYAQKTIIKGDALEPVI
jgi:ribonuclease HII